MTNGEIGEPKEPEDRTVYTPNRKDRGKDVAGPHQ